MERQYIGARYVPKFAEPLAWNNALSYEAMTIVTYLGNSFTSKKPVPAGVDIANTEYWVNTGNYNAQVEQYRQEVEELKTTVDGVSSFGKSVKSFGAVGDGVTDDTEAFQSAIYDFQQNGVPIFVPNGTYLISSPLVINTSNGYERRFALYGQNRYKTVIRTTATPMFNFSMPDTDTIMQSYIENLCLIGNATAVCLLFHRAQKWSIKNVIFRNFKTDIKADLSWTFYVGNCEFSENVENQITHIDLQDQTNGWLIENCNFAMPLSTTSTKPNVAMYSGGSSIKISRCNFQGGYGVLIRSLKGTRTNVDVDTCYFENINGFAVYTEQDSGGKLYGLTISDCYMVNMEGATKQSALCLNAIDGVTVTGNYAVRYNNYFILSNIARIGDNYFIAANVYGGDAALISGGNVYSFTGGNHVPTAGKHSKGEVVYNHDPAAGAPIGWVCTAAGSPGTWVAMSNL